MRCLTDLLLKKSADKVEEIRRHQPSSPAAASSCQVTQTAPSTFVVVARAVAVAVTVVGGDVGVGFGTVLFGSGWF